MDTPFVKNSAEGKDRLDTEVSHSKDKAHFNVMILDRKG